MVMGVITVVALIGMFAMGVALKNFQNVQKVKAEKQIYYSTYIYEDENENQIQ